ncbi:MAG TPA: hypothetical protein DER64_10595 [Planctomycetaceae bacterium]|nr:hypothetical protein [Planctomycetaceae bacterium]
MRIEILLAVVLSLAAGGIVSAVEPTVVRPARVELHSPEDSVQVLAETVTGGRTVDRTRDARWAVDDKKVARVDRTGLVTPLSNGKTSLKITLDGVTRSIDVVVDGVAQPRPLSFQQDVIPILTKARCNSGGCHGKAEGQNGFKLSVFGFDTDADHAALTKEKRGGRVSPAMPDNSLLLTKGASTVPHGGGRKLKPNGRRFQRLRRWVAEGARFDVPGRVCTSIRVDPPQRLLGARQSQQMRVIASDAEGNSWCVTAEAEFESNNDVIATVNRRGLVFSTEVPGEAAILVRYMGQVAVSRITRPQPDVVFQRPPEHNFIDKHVWNRLAELGIAPSPLADDATFLRRAHLDTIGTLPTVDEARAFLADKNPDKRNRMVAGLLDRKEYAFYWAMKWADVLRVDNAQLKPQVTVAITRWLRRQMAENVPFDRFAREILTVRGNTRSETPAAVYSVLKSPGELARSISQLFLGVRIECAQCHHHPFEKWAQKDYFALAGFFTGVKRDGKNGGWQKITDGPGSDLKHPRSGQVVPTAGLGSAPITLEDPLDRRRALSDWMTAPENPFFARTIVNRLWAHYLGRGLVEPIDDHRATNPASNEKLLDALAAEFRRQKYDLKAFTRTLLASRTYQLSSSTVPDNELDDQNFSHATKKALPAEVLLDAICQATGIPEQFNGWPTGSRAIEIWDNRLPSYFFVIFGRPQRNSVCECERGNEPSISQALHLMNSPESFQKIRHRDGRAAGLAAKKLSDEQVIDELFLATLSRVATDRERKLLLAAFTESSGNRREAVEDILWTLLNTKEFLYNH